MAIKYPENTSYSASSLRNKFPQLSRATTKKLAAQATGLVQEKLASLSSGAKSVAPKVPLAAARTTTPVEENALAQALPDSGVTIEPGYAPGTLVSEYKNLTGKNYTFDTPDTGYEKKGRYLSPSEMSNSAKFQSIREDLGGGALGGGQYVIDPANKGRAIASTRSDTTWKEREIELQGLDPTLFEVDHKIPLWAGGSDTEANKEILSTPEHATKTKIQSIPLTLLANGLIDQREAMSMAMNWKAKAETWDIKYPTPSSGKDGSGIGAGLIDVKEAQRIAKKWGEAPDVTWKSFLSELPGAGKWVYGKAGEVVNTILPGESAGKVAIKEFTKGLASAIPGYSLAMPQLDTAAAYNDKTANTTGQISHVLGATIGNIYNFGSAYKLALKALSKTGVKWAVKAIGKEIVEKEASTIAAGAIKTSKNQIAQKLTSLLKKPTGEIIDTVNRQITKEAKKVLTKPLGEIAGKAATMGVVSTALGQLRPLETENRAERAAWDFAYGAFNPTSKLGYKVTDYAGVAGPALIISLLEGLRLEDSFTNALASALISSGTMAGVHGLGHAGATYKVLTGKAPKSIAYVGEKTERQPESYWSGGKLVTVAGAKTNEVKIKAAERKFSNAYRQSQYVDLLEDIDSGLLRASDVGVTSRKEISYKTTTNQNAVDTQNSILIRYAHWKERQYGWNAETAAKEVFKVISSGRGMWKSGLGTVARNKADIEDLVSYAEKMNKNNPNSLTTPKNIDNLSANISESFYNEAPSIESAIVNKKSSNLNAEVPVTGYGIDSNTSKFKRFITSIKSGKIPATPEVDANGNETGRYFIKAVMSHETNHRNSQAVAENAAKNGYNAADSVRIYVSDGNGRMEDIGYISTRGRIEGRIDSFNNNAIKRYNEAAAAKGEPLIRIEDLTPEQREAMGLFDPDINNETVARRMKEKNSPAMEVTILVDPETKNNKNYGFIKAFLNDGSWDENRLSAIKELMAKEVNFTPKEIESVVEAITEEPEVKAAMIQKTPSDLVEIMTGKKKEKDVTLEEFEKWLDSKEPGDAPASFVDAIRMRKPKIKLPVRKPEENVRIAEETGAEMILPKSPLIAETPAITREAIETESRAAREIEPENSINDVRQEVIDDADVSTAANYETQTNNDIQSNAGTRAWSKYDQNGINEGPAKVIGDYKDSLPEGSKERANAEAVLNSFSKEKIISKAKEIFKANNGKEEKSVSEFKDIYTRKFTDLGLPNPLENKRTDLYVTKLFRDAAYSTPKNVLTLVKGKWVIEPRANILKSKLASDIEKYNAENGTDIDMIYYEPGKNIKPWETPDIDEINKQLKSKGYISLGASGNALNTIYAVKYDKSLGSNVNEFVYNVFRKIMKFPEGTTASSVNKRAKLFDDKSLPNPVQGETYKHHVLSPEINTLRKMGYTEDYFAKAIQKGLATEKSVAAVLDKDIFDGKIYITEGMMKRILKGGGYVGKRTRLKPTMVAGEDAMKMLQKGDLSVLDKVHTEFFENIIRKETGNKNFKIRDNDVITFPENVKVGAIDKKARYSAFDAPSDSYRFKYSYEPKPKVSFSISNWAKFMKDADLNKTVSALYAPHIEKYKAFLSELNSSVGSKEGLAVLEKYEEYGKKNFGENLYGALKKQVANGAWNKSIGYNIDQLTNKIFQEKIMSGSFLRGDHLTLTPDFGVKKGGKFLEPGEVMISREMWESLGSPEYVLTVRYPVTRATAMTKSKVVVAQDHGIKNLGKEQIIPSQFDTFVRKEGDYDADSFHVFAIDGENGIPMKVADKIESVRAEEGDMVMDPLKKYDESTMVMSKDNAYDKLQELTKNAVAGGEGVGKVATLVRVLPFLAETGFSVSGYKPAWNSRNMKILSELSQFSTDAVKSPSLHDTIEDDDMTDYIIRNVFSNDEGIKPKAAQIKVIKKAIKRQGYQTPFEVSDKGTPLKSNSDLFKRIADYNRLAGEKGGPAQSIMKLFSGVEPYAYKFKKAMPEDIAAAETAVKDKFKGEFKVTPNVSTFQKKFKLSFKKMVDSNPEDDDFKRALKDFKQSVIDFYRYNESKYSPEERRSIQLWLASNPEANIAQKKRNPDGSLTYKGKSNWANKIDDIFNDSPDIAQTYYDTLEKYNLE